MIKPSFRHVALATLVATVSFAAQAQAQAQAQAPAPAPAPAQASSADDARKLQLAHQIIALLHPEQVAVGMAQRPALNAVTQSRIALQGRVGPKKQAETMKAIDADAKAFVDQVSPIALAAGQRANESVAVPMLMKEFSLQELQQLLAMLQSPVREKFGEFMPRMDKAIGDRVAADIGPQVNPKMQLLTETVGMRLRNAAGM